MSVGIQYACTAMEVWLKIVFVVLSYPIIWALECIKWVIKPIRVVLAFIVGGLQAVLKTLGIGIFGEKVYYAILKENGQYLKIE